MSRLTTQIASASAVVQPEQQQFPYLVIDDRLAVHSAPQRSAPVMAVRKKGDCISVTAVQGTWLRLSGWWHPHRDQDEVLEQFGATEAWVSLFNERNGKPQGAALQPIPDNFLLRLALRLGATQGLACSRLRSQRWSEADRVTAVSVHSPAFGLEARRDPSWAAEVGLGASKDPASWRVFATRGFARGELVERCELLRIHPDKRGHVMCDDSIFKRHLVSDNLSDPDKAFAVPLGYGMLYRRVKARNGAELTMSWDMDESALFLLAQARIEPGEELLLPHDACSSLAAQAQTISVLPSTFQTADPSSRKVESLMYSSAGVTTGGVQARESWVHGRGVFALQKLWPHMPIELCPAIVLKSPGDVSAVDDYVMNVQESAGKKDKVDVLALGCGALYNHDDSPIVAWEYAPCLSGEGLVVMTAMNEVEAGQELFISYGRAYWSSPMREKW